MEYVIAIIAILVGSGGGWILLRRASVAPTILVFEKTIEGYKAMAVMEEQNKELLKQERSALADQLKAKDALYKQLQTAYDSERARTTRLESMSATWILEKADLNNKINTLQDQVKALQTQLNSQRSN